ncbi:uncharacterized protein LOC106135927 [Amyelois transitella]|uniref:uncharacterized protein LOC106135927 n=1 Tax=Amyelois transitella TaxID=680683 RepID=UPI0029907BD4|nr:uncharacterized protein LOC106135927 [Amyelois transitella]XP_060801508.1 uncharacterized protein LOC106135927 [Amyelois transitella]
MIAKFIFVLCFAYLCQSAFIDTLNKCNIGNEVCCKNTLEKAVKDISKTGLPEYNIPPLDPLHLKNVSVSILNVVDLTLVDGVVKGFKDCIFNRFKVDIESSRAHLDVTCDIVVKGRYKAASSGDIVRTLFGDETVRGDGNTRIKIEKIHVILDFDFALEKHNGEIYIIDKSDKLNYKYEIEGRMLFAADNLYLGNVESSKFITDFLNQNWRGLFSTFGGGIMDRALEIVHSLLKSFYSSVPTRYFVIEDLTPYVTN